MIEIIPNKKPKISVIIPLYNGSMILKETIRSVLEQTYENYEIILVDDASTDNSQEIINQIQNPKIHYIQHDENRGANAARNTGIRSSSGEIIAFLDQDDLFHPEKLEVHVNYFNSHPEIGFTYNSRFNLNHSASTIRDIWIPPRALGLQDLILGFPVSPSEMVVKKEWLNNSGFWDDVREFNGGEITLTGRLFLSGCKFASVERILNYRNHISGRRFANIRQKCLAELRAQENILNDPRTSDDVKSIRNRAFMNTYLIWGYVALSQNDTSLGQEFIREAIVLDRSILNGSPKYIVTFYLYNSITDAYVDHELLLMSLFEQTPKEIILSPEELDWAISRGYLIKGISATIWGRNDDANKNFTKAKYQRAKLDDILINDIVYQLLAYDKEFGDKATNAVINKLARNFEYIASSKYSKKLKGCFYLNTAFQSYRDKRYGNVPFSTLKALKCWPAYISNRGTLSILMKSLARIISPVSFL